MGAITAFLARAPQIWARSLKQAGAGRGRVSTWGGNLVPAWRSGQPAAWADDPVEQVKHYKHWVFTAVNAIARKIAQTPMELYYVRGPKKRLLQEHPFLDLMAKVNPFHTYFWMWQQTIMFLELTGNGYWYVARNGLDRPGEVWVLPSQNMKIVPSDKTYIAGYEYTSGNKTIKFAANEILHFKFPNPNSLYYGRGPLQAAAECVDTHEMARTSEYWAMKEGIHADLAISTDQELTDETITRIQAAIRQKYGSPEQSGRPLILEQGLAASKINLTPREMNYMQSTKMTREEVLGIFGVPPAVAGITENVNKAVADAQYDMFLELTIDPTAAYLAAQINQDLLPMYGNPEGALMCRFKPIARFDRTRDREDERLDLQQGARTINEVRAARMLEPVSWGDKPWMPLNLYQPGGASPPVEPMPAPDVEPEASPRSSRLARRKGLLPDERRAVSAEFVKAITPREQSLKDKLVSYFNALSRRIAAKLRSMEEKKAIAEGDPDTLTALLMNPDEMAGALKEIVDPALLEAIRAGALRQIAELGVDMAFALHDKRAEEWLRKWKGSEYWSGNSSPLPETIRQIHDALAEGLAEGESYRELAERIEGLPAFDEARALRVARTETVGASNYGSQAVRDGLRADGYRIEKVWIATLDNSTRPDHEAADGQGVDDDKPFQVGGETLMYPGDPSASAEQIVHCRCTTATEIVGEPEES